MKSFIRSAQNALHIHAAQREHLLHWLPYAFITTVVVALFYVTLSAHIRTQADDPQVYLAENLAMQLFKNQEPSALLPTQETDIEHSVAPFVILYDSNGRAEDGTGRIHDQLPELPRGAYDYAQAHGEYRFTWSPQLNTKVATVVKYYQNEQHAGYVLAGKNIREVQREQNRLLLNAAIAWALSLIGTLILTGIGHKSLRIPKARR